MTVMIGCHWPVVPDSELSPSLLLGAPGVGLNVPGLSHTSASPDGESPAGAGSKVHLHQRTPVTVETDLL